MHTQTLPYLPLAKTLWPGRTLARDLSLVLGGSLLVALTAQVALPLPFTPVPITLQTLGVLLVGAALGSRLGFLALTAYLLEGAMGLPVFAGGTGGLAKILGPTGGFLLAFPLAAGLVGLLVERLGLDRKPLGTLLAMLLGNALLYLLGLPWLAAWLAGVGKFAGTGALLAMGLFPFLPGDLVKAVLAALLLPSAWRFLGRR
ncbi:MAG: biotin transporter BioY [Thermus sp.]|uniref:biotin transporter BioY n=1 Tax=unclassified Thermus TaxID=2619321 RepID=UPI0002389F77|nr:MULTISPECIES: biotin transporter BioY [unclassified Thermus]AEV16155.1 BioY [Thermus sp. CCB_US3_UF1]MCS6868906.1 biotin transporter BioY [Thermus sp.]MCS7218773.1 biotin transporter BioY [Thermus sp.]MCX7848980.1 biotin transporter BioY [Thermus sp.]MDW8017438.1 biotin transporter BioY [Thermus sp.]